MKISLKIFKVLLASVILAGLLPYPAFATYTGGARYQEPPPPPINQVTAPYNLYLPSISQVTSSHTVLGVEMDSVAEGRLLDLADQAGVKWVRRNGVFWNLIEPIEGMRDWSSLASLEREMILLSQSGMKMVLIVRGVPEWARADHGHICGPIAQAKYNAFASFMRELVSRYSVAPYNVLYWELGNEPDAPFISDTSPFGCWGDPGNQYYGGGKYGKMLNAVYPQIKAANPEAQVLVGGLLMDCDPTNPPLENGEPKDCRMSKFLEGMLLENAGDSFDGVSFHSYDYYNYAFPGEYANGNWNSTSSTTGPTTQAKAKFLKSVLERFGQTDKYLLASETALLCGVNCTEDYESTKAIYATQNYILSLVNNLKSSIWYSYTNPWRFANLVESANPKPAYFALQTVSEKFAHAIFRQTINQPGLSIYEFTRHGDQIWIVWSPDGIDRAISLPEPPDQIWDLFGNSLPVNNPITIGRQPVYLEWSD